MKQLWIKFKQYFIENKYCTHCNGGWAVVKATRHSRDVDYLCSNCLRTIRFLETRYYSSILDYGRYR